MRIGFIALAVLSAASGLASAQSNLTIYGSIDGGLRYQTHTTAAGDSLTTQTSGQYYSNRLGFRVAEDLGDGLKALVTLESGYFVDTGAQDVAGTLFNRTAAVGLGSRYGTVMLGRNYTVAYWTVAAYDPFSYRFPTLAPLISGGGTSQPADAVAAGLGASATSGTRFNNDVQYIGTFGGLTARAEYSAGEVAGNSRAGSAKAAAFTYVAGEFTVAGAYTLKHNALAFRNRATTAGGAWNHNDLKVTVGYAAEKQDASARQYGNRLVWTGVSYRFTPLWSATAAVYRTDVTTTGQSGRRDLYVLGASYTLSKRTLIYGGVDSNNYQGVLIPASRQRSQLGTSAGLLHTF
jgi:predicted porin